MKPKVSVIIPTHNSSKFINRAIESVLSQTFGDFELIIVDDGSTDDTVSVIDKYLQRDKRIKLLKLKSNSGGPAKPTNEGMRMATGEFLAFLDHDDWWLAEKLEEQVNALEKSDGKYGAVVCDIKLKSPGIKTGVEYKFPKDIAGENGLKLMLCGSFFFNFSILTIKRQVVDDVGFLDEKFTLGADQDYFIRIARKYSFKTINKPLVWYSFHGGNASISTIPRKETITDLEYLLSKHMDLFINFAHCHHLRLLRLASALLLSGRAEDARVVLKNSVKIYKMSLKAAVLYLLTFFGSGFYRASKLIKSKLF
jgi:glycosyltransferase involved in cell wall biosynthesis